MQALYIPSQGGGVAGDVNDPGNARLDKGICEIGVHALAGRVQHHHLRGLVLLQQPGQGQGGVAACKFRPIEQAVEAGVFPSVIHRLGTISTPRALCA